MTVQEKISVLKDRFGKDAREIAELVYNEISNTYDDFVINTGNAGGHRQLGKYWKAIVDELSVEE